VSLRSGVLTARFIALNLTQTRRVFQKQTDNKRYTNAKRNALSKLAARFQKHQPMP